MAVVELDRLSKRYGGRSTPLIVDEVTLTVNDGEFMVLLGPSGCGKSTTLRMIAGLEAISSGILTIDGRVMNRVLAKDRDIAMVFQSYALYPHMTVEENLAFGLRRRRAGRDEVLRRVRETAELLGLSAYLNAKPSTLSGGQRQRVALGRAMVRNPTVFLFDEPLSNLDAALRVNTRSELIKQHRRLGSTMIYVTHDQVEAMTMGTRICVMNQGRVAQTGAPLEVYWNPADTFVARFLGSPPMNLFNGAVVTGNGHFSFNGDAIKSPLVRWATDTLSRLAGKLTVLGVRAEDLHRDSSRVSLAECGSISGRVFAVEPLGAETLAVVEIRPGTECTARLPRTVNLKPGEKVEFFFDPRCAYLFDAETGKALPATSPGFLQ
jgi:multiple sugar transport system ATP-binding protein